MYNTVIYLRSNDWWDQLNIVKIGISTNIIKRENPYKTCEPKSGFYITIYEIHKSNINIVDRMFKNYFSNYNMYIDGGTEFFDKSIIPLIPSFFEKLNIEFKILSDIEITLINNLEKINNLKNIDKIKKLINKVDVNLFIKKLKNRKNICVKQHQINILNNIEKFYTENDIGKIIWACGLGKTIMSLLIIQKLNFKKILIGVPGNILQDSFKDEINKLFLDANILFIGGKDSVKDLNIIKNFLKANNSFKFIITTYQSCSVLLDNEIKFDIKIGDEAHHLVGFIKEDDKGFRCFHKILSNKTLFMTATEKMIEGDQTYSMEDEKIFGKYIDLKSINWAIENKMITDYNILVLKNTEDQVDLIISKLGIKIDNKELFISAYISIKSMQKYNDLTHILIYTNSIEEANLVSDYVSKILPVLGIEEKDFYNKSLNSSNCNLLKDEIIKFKNCKKGIISCIYIFGEGFNEPKLNGVCVACNMQSIIRIVQYLLRPNRLDRQNANKKAFIILPYIDLDDWNKKNDSFEKVRNVIHQMRNSDEGIEFKIKMITTKKDKDEDKIKEKNKCDILDLIDLEENENELDKLKVRLRFSKTLLSNNSEEQDEYNYIKLINKNLNISSKQDYFLNSTIHNYFIPDPEAYFKKSGVWINWYNFLSIDTSYFLKDKEEWIQFCKEKNINNVEEYYNLCDQYNQLPREPADFYNNFTNISSELHFELNFFEN